MDPKRRRDLIKRLRGPGRRADSPLKTGDLQSDFRPGGAAGQQGGAAGSRAASQKSYLPRTASEPAAGSLFHPPWQPPARKQDAEMVPICKAKIRLN